MRNRIFFSAILIVGYVVTSSASCGSSGTGGGGTTGSGGSTGAGGGKGTAGSGGTKGTAGSGGTSGSSDPCIKDPTKCTADLTGLTGACKTCIATSCSSEFITCESTPDCVTGINCIIACFYQGGLLTECAKTCGPDASTTLTTVVTDAVLCVAGSCGTTTTCNPMGVTKDAGGGG
jgi:hypothetical protein